MCLILYKCNKLICWLYMELQYYYLLTGFQTNELKLVDVNTIAAEVAADL